jgi:hypothetical protein
VEHGAAEINCANNTLLCFLGRHRCQSQPAKDEKCHASGLINLIKDG